MRGYAPKITMAPEGLVPLAPMPGEPSSEVAALPVKGWARRNPWAQRVEIN